MAVFGSFFFSAVRAGKGGGDPVFVLADRAECEKNGKDPDAAQNFAPGPAGGCPDRGQ